MQRRVIITVIVVSLLFLSVPLGCNETGEVETTIGPDGGTLEDTNPGSPIFGAELVVPAGAVDEDVVISLSEGTDADDPDLVGIPISCEPDGYLFNQNVTLTIPLGGPYPEDDLLMLMVYNATSGTYEYAGRLAEVHSGDTEVTVDITHFSSFQFMGVDDNFGRLNSVQLLATTIWTIKSAIEAKDCSELRSIKQLLGVFQDDYEEAMYGFVAAHGWCLEHYTLSHLLEQTWELVRDHVLIHGTAALLGVTLPTIAAFLSTVGSAVAAGLLLSAPLCFLWTSWLNPIFLNAWVGYTVCEYGIATIELALADPEIGCECLRVDGEGLADEAPIPGWDLVFGGPPPIATVTATDDAAGIHSGDRGVRVNGDFHAGKEFDIVAKGIVTVDYWHFPKPGSSTNSQFLLYGGEHPGDYGGVDYWSYLAVHKNDEDLWWISDGGGQHPSVASYSEEYTHIVIIIDTDTGLFDLNIDEELVYQGTVEYADRIEASGIRYVAVHSGRGATGQDSYFDDFVVTCTE